MEGTLSKAPSRPAPGGGSGASASASGSALLRFVKFAAAIALLPICAGMTHGMYEIVQAAWNGGGAGWSASRDLVTWFASGGALFAIFALLLWRPVVVYVFGHELVHALATWLCLGSVSNFRASASGGSVVSSKSNTLIRLAPYCLPLYALLAAGIYLALDRWWRPLNAQLHWAVFVLGFFYAFHLGFTIWSMRRDQPDLKPDGWFFSLIAIYLANLAVFALTIGFVLTGKAQYAWPALRCASVLGWHHSAETYQHIADSLRGVYSHYANR